MDEELGSSSGPRKSRRSTRTPPELPESLLGNLLVLRGYPADVPIVDCQLSYSCDPWGEGGVRRAPVPHGSYRFAPQNSTGSSENS